MSVVQRATSTVYLDGSFALLCKPGRRLVRQICTGKDTLLRFDVLRGDEYIRGQAHTLRIRLQRPATSLGLVLENELSKLGGDVQSLRRG
jgi:hypothetical protein